MDLVSVIAADDLPERLAADPGLANARDDHGVSALLLSLYHRRPDARDALLAAGAEVGPLEAAALGDVSRLKVDARGADGFTSLHLAAFFGGAEAVRALLAAGADPDADADNVFKVHPIHSASAVGDHASVRALLEAGATPNGKQQGGFSPPHAAAHKNDVAPAGPPPPHRAGGAPPTDEGQTPPRPAQGGEG